MANAEVYAFITCRNEMHGDMPIENFRLREDYIEKFCNENGSENKFHKRASGEIIVDFDSLDQVNLELVGVFGRKQCALLFFGQFLTEESVHLLQDCFSREGPGMYLVATRKSSLSRSTELATYIFTLTKKTMSTQVQSPARFILCVT